MTNNDLMQLMFNKPVYDNVYQLINDMIIKMTNVDEMSRISSGSSTQDEYSKYTAMLKTMVGDYVDMEAIFGDEWYSICTDCQTNTEVFNEQILSSNNTIRMVMICRVLESLQNSMIQCHSDKMLAYCSTLMELVYGIPRPVSFVTSVVSPIVSFGRSIDVIANDHTQISSMVRIVNNAVILAPTLIAYPGIGSYVQMMLNVSDRITVESMKYLVSLLVVHMLIIVCIRDRSCSTKLDNMLVTTTQAHTQFSDVLIRLLKLRI